MNIFIATFIKCKSIFVDENQKYNQDYPVPYKLAGLLKKCGYTMKEELRGWISPKYENKILESLESYLKQTFGIDENWRGVYVSPDDDSYENSLKLTLDQLMIYADPGHIENTRNEEESDTWETNNYTETDFLGKSGTKDITKSISDLLKSPIPLGNQDSEILDWGLSGLELNYPDRIECKEILCKVFSK